MCSTVTGLYPHHHGYLHWDVALAPTAETLFRALGAHGYEVGTFVFDTNFRVRDPPEPNVRARHWTARSGGSAQSREKPFLRVFHDWATHMPYAVLHPERKDWRGARQEVFLPAVSVGVRRSTDARSRVSWSGGV